MDADDDCHHHHHRVVWWWSHACLFRHKRIHHQLDTLTDRQTWFNDDVHQDLGQFSSRKKTVSLKASILLSSLLRFLHNCRLFLLFVEGCGEVLEVWKSMLNIEYAGHLINESFNLKVIAFVSFTYRIDSQSVSHHCRPSLQPTQRFEQIPINISSKKGTLKILTHRRLLSFWMDRLAR